MDREVEMRRVRAERSRWSPRRRRSRRAQAAAFPQARRVALEVGVVVAVAAGRIDMVEREAAQGVARQAHHHPVVHRPHRRVAGRHDVDGPVAPAAGAGVVEAVGQARHRRARDGEEEAAPPQLLEGLRRAGRSRGGRRRGGHLRSGYALAGADRNPGHEAGGRDQAGRDPQAGEAGRAPEAARDPLNVHEP